MNRDGNLSSNDNGAPELWDLKLYVAGQTPKSVAALTNLIGDLSNSERVLVGLDLQSRS